ncbi:Uncharacterised protein [Vibrio cholerae]|nr:Uncharacterised protein [Vibrio cholerae]
MEHQPLKPLDAQHPCLVRHSQRYQQSLHPQLQV